MDCISHNKWTFLKHVIVHLVTQEISNVPEIIVYLFAVKSSEHLQLKNYMHYMHSCMSQFILIQCHECIFIISGSMSIEKKWLLTLSNSCKIRTWVTFYTCKCIPCIYGQINCHHPCHADQINGTISIHVLQRTCIINSNAVIPYNYSSIILYNPIINAG